MLLAKTLNTQYLPKRLRLLGACLVFLGSSILPSGVHAADGIVSGKIALPEISGALSVGNRLLVVADDVEDEEDDVRKFHMVVLLNDAATRLKAGGVIAPTEEEQVYKTLLEKLKKSDFDFITDFEDITASPQGEIYLINSHSLSKKDKRPPKRQRLVKLGVKPESGEIVDAVANPRSLIDAVPAELKDSLTKRPGAMEGDKYTPGFNIEGLAWAPDNGLFAGLRSPLLDDKKAVVLRLTNVNSPFDNAPDPSAPPKFIIEAKLDLGGMGIRGMSYDEQNKGYWLIAGISPDPDKADPKLPNDWSVWFWNGKDTPEKRWDKKKIPAGMTLDNPEAICLVGSGDAERFLLLVSDDGSKTPSSYLLIPLQELK
jgi:hypothetical protein